VLEKVFKPENLTVFKVKNSKQNNYHPRPERILQFRANSWLGLVISANGIGFQGFFFTDSSFCTVKSKITISS
jgi:hypothetical protein